MRHYYSEWEPYAAEWLANLGQAGLIPAGRVDQRDVQEVRANDLEGYQVCHFFAGLGGWAYALQLAGWPATRPVWTASLPCQPFSAAGKQKGEEDERHLWPVFFRLVCQRRPSVVFGEQVNSDDGYRWIAGIRHDLEAEGYAVGCADLPACSQGAPHIRGRLFWVAVRLGDSYGQRQQRDSQQKAGLEAPPGPDADRSGERTGRLPDAGPRRHGAGLAGSRGGSAPGELAQGGRPETTGELAGHCSPVRLADNQGDRLARRGECDNIDRTPDADRESQPGGTGVECCGVGDCHGIGSLARGGHAGEPQDSESLDPGASVPTLRVWDRFAVVFCRDEKHRRIPESVVQCLADGLPAGMDGLPAEAGYPLAAVAGGIPGRRGALRAFGNAIVPQVAAAFIRAYLEAEQEVVE